MVEKIEFDWRGGLCRYGFSFLAEKKKGDQDGHVSESVDICQWCVIRLLKG